MNVESILAKLPEGIFTLRDRVEHVLLAIKEDATPAPNPTTRKFHRDYLRENLDLPGGEFSLKDRVTDQGRWDTYHELIFREPETPDGYGWLTSYSTASTENGDTKPFDDEEEHECTLVRLAPKMIKTWIPAVMPEGGA
jgi:hypothetical protein